MFGVICCALGPLFPGPGFSDARGRAWGGFLQMLAVIPPCDEAVVGRHTAGRGRRRDRFQDLAIDFTSRNITQVLRGTSIFGQFQKRFITVGGKMKRSHRVALKPTPEQESLFGQHAGMRGSPTTGLWVNSRLAWTLANGCPTRRCGQRWNVIKGITRRGARRCPRTQQSTPSSTWARRRMPGERIASA